MHEMDSLKDLSARSTSPPSHQRQQDRFRMLRPLLAACFVFAAAMLLSRTLGPAVGGRLTASPSSERDSTLTVRQTNEPEFYTTDCASPQTAAVAQGVDLVAYFSLQTWEPAVAGKTEYASTYQAYRFLFSSAEHKTMFEEQPSRYIPKWGGFCAWGISQEESWTQYTLGPPTNPDSWLVTADGKLFLFRSDWNKALFVEDILGYTEAGDTKWDSWFGDGSTSSSEQHAPLDTDCFCFDKAGDDGPSIGSGENCYCGDASC